LSLECESKHKSDDFIAPPCREDIEIIYRDESLLLINKPSGLLSLSGKNPLNKDSVHYRLVQNYPTATLLHRLDFGTSGIMLVALNKWVNGLLTKQFQERTIYKTYTAVLQGLIERGEGTIDFPIGRGEFPLQKICLSSGKAAHSEYRVLKRLQKPARTRVIFTPHSGRTHQLRIHSQEIGHPILGCDLYYGKGLDKYDTHSAYLLSPRLMLHATTLDFDHPVSGERINSVSVCPF